MGVVLAYTESKPELFGQGPGNVLVTQLVPVMPATFHVIWLPLLASGLLPVSLPRSAADCQACVHLPSHCVHLMVSAVSMLCRIVCGGYAHCYLMPLVFSVVF